MRAYQAQSAKQRQGELAETRAAAYLQEQGLTLLGRNVASPLGEVDLLCQQGGQWVFVEVRQRSSMAFGGAAASVTVSKQHKLRRQAQAVLLERFGRQSWPSFRFDVVAIEAGKINWIQNAF